MPGVLIHLDDHEFQRRITAMQKGLEDATPLMRVWGEIVQTSIATNFEVGGRPPWEPLAALTVKSKGHARPLIGRTGNLQRTTVKPEAQRLVIGTSPSTRAYAAIQQFGGRAGRGHKVTIRARPYILLQDGDVKEMGDETRVYLRRLASS